MRGRRSAAVLGVACSNAVANGVGACVRTEFLSWGELAPDGDWDLVVAADVMFSTFVVRSLLRTVSSAIMRSRGCVFLLASSFRSAELDAEIELACGELQMNRRVIVRVATDDVFLLIEEFGRATE